MNWYKPYFWQVDERARAFTLIEVLICLGIFSIGFAAIAMMLPAGLVMQRDIAARATGDIVSKNALEVVKAKGVFSLGLDYYPPNASYMTVPLPMSNWDEKYQFFFDANYNAPGGWPWTINGAEAASTIGPYLNCAADGTFIWTSGYGCRVAGWANATNYAYGTIHAFTNRGQSHNNPAIYGISNYQAFSNLDFSYPSSVLDITARTYFCNLMLTNLSTTPNSTCTWSLFVCRQDTDQWRVTAVTLMKPATGEWLEQCESDGTNPDSQGNRSGSAWQFNGSSNPVMLTSNTPVDMRSIGGDSAIAGLPDPNATLWPRYYNPGNAQSASMGAVPKTGGDPGNSDAWGRGAVTQYVASWIAYYGRYGGGNYGPAWNSGDCRYVSPPIREDSTGGGISQYKYTDPVYNKVVGWTAPNYYRYPVPGILQTYVTVYDRDNDLLLLRYPLSFAKTLRNAPNIGSWTETSDARVANFQAAIGGNATTGAGWVDRKLQVNDQFMLSRGAYTFTVKEVIDASAAAAAVNAAIGDQVDWSDGTYQIVRVSPSLRTTTLTANQPNWYRTQSSWTAPDPIGAFVAPPPCSGGLSPWVSTLQLDDGGSVSRTPGAFTRPWNCLTN